METVTISIPDTAYRVSIPWYQGDWGLTSIKVYIDSKPYYFGHDGELWRNRYVRSLGGIPGGYKSMDFGTFYLGDDGQYVTAGKRKAKKNIIILNTDGKLEESDSTTMTAKPMLWGNLLGSQKVSVTLNLILVNLSKIV